MSPTRAWIRRDERGAAAVEFAVVLPLLVVLIVGMVELGLAFNAKITVNHAAREGARMAAVGKFNEAAIVDMVGTLANVSGVSVTPAAVTGDPALGDYYAVTVGCQYHLVIPFWDDVSFALSSTAKMRKEQ